MRKTRKFNLLAMLVMGLALTFTGCKKDPCKDVTCLNGGACVDGSCQCADGYEGTDCGTESRTKFLGDYQVAETCNSINYNYTSTISVSSANHQRVNFSNFYDLQGSYGVSTPVYGEVTGNAVVIPSQNVTGGPANIDFQVSGNGSYSGGNISLTYTVTDNNTSNSESCTATYTPL